MLHPWEWKRLEELRKSQQPAVEQSRPHLWIPVDPPLVDLTEEESEPWEVVIQLLGGNVGASEE